MSKKDLHIPVSQDLIKDLLPLLGRDEDITGIVDQLLKSELESRLGLSHTNDITYDVDADRAFPSLTEELPVKPQYLDLKHIDRDVVKEVIGNNKIINNKLLDKIPKELHSLLEYDLMSSNWHPRSDWKELLDDYLDNGSHVTLDSWIEVRRQKDLEDEASMWIEISRKSLDD